MLLFFVVFKKNSYLSALIEVQEGQKIIDNGPYGVIRHPMYSAALLLLFFRP
jgi:protein-S-isoprenylcysteine O-methyltransferase Ste14